VIHEKSIEFLEELPEIFHYRYRVFFSIPFRLMIGPYYSLGDDFRGRIAYNLPYFKAVEDAFTLAIPSTAIIRDFFKFAPDLLNPRKVLGNLVRGINSRYGYAYSFFTGPAYLPMPVFHYQGVMPEDFIVKYLSRAEKYGYRGGIENLRSAMNLVRNNECPNTKEIWERVVEAFIGFVVEDIKKAGHEKIYLEALARHGASERIRGEGRAFEISPEDNPRIMWELIKCECCRKYFIRESLIENLKDL
jgi:hypothetical protein